MNKEKTVKAGGSTALYVRTSREFRGIERVSISQQLHDGAELIRSKQLPASGSNVFVDENRSGSYPPEQWPDLAPSSQNGKPTKQRRAGFTKLIDGMMRGEITGVVARKRNRLMRGFEIHRAFWRLCQKLGVKVFLTHESTGEDGLSVDLQALIAEHQLVGISDDIRAARKYIRNHGRKSSPIRSIGYAEGTAGKATVVEEQAQLVRHIYERFAEQGLSRLRLASELNVSHPITLYPRAGVEAVRWTWAALTKVLTNPSYIGLSTDTDGNHIPSLCYPQIVEKTLWQRAQDRIARDSNPRCGVRYHDHILGGLLTCAGCGKSLNCKVTRHHKTGQIVDHVYQCVNPACTGTDKAAGIREHYWTLWCDSYMRIGFAEPKGGDTELADLQIKRARVQANLDALLKDVTADYASSAERERAYKAALVDCDSRIALLRNVRRVWQEVTPQVWNGLSVLERRQRISSAVESIAVGRNWVVVKYRPGVTADMCWEIRGEFRPELLSSPRAYPVMYIRGEGRNYSKCLTHPQMAERVWRQGYGLAEINGVRCLVPSWAESHFVEGGTLTPILQAGEFRFRDQSQAEVLRSQ